MIPALSKTVFASCQVNNIEIIEIQFRLVLCHTIAKIACLAFNNSITVRSEFFTVQRSLTFLLSKC